MSSTKLLWRPHREALTAPSTNEQELPGRDILANFHSPGMRPGRRAVSDSGGAETPGLWWQGGGSQHSTTHHPSSAPHRLHSCSMQGGGKCLRTLSGGFGFFLPPPPSKPLGEFWDGGWGWGWEHSGLPSCCWAAFPVPCLSFPTGETLPQPLSSVSCFILAPA